MNYGELLGQIWQFADNLAQMQAMQGSAATPAQVSRRFVDPDQCGGAFREGCLQRRGDARSSRRDQLLRWRSQ